MLAAQEGADRAEFFLRTEAAAGFRRFRFRARVTMVADRLRETLSDLPGVKVQDLGRVRSGIVTFTKGDEQPRDIESRLRAANINVSVSSRSSAQLDFGRRGRSQVVRASMHYFNTEEEI